MRVCVLYRRHDDDGGRLDPRAAICGVFTRDAEIRYVDDHPLQPAQWYHAHYFDIDVGLPGTAGAEPAENAPDCEDGAAPVPAQFAAIEDPEC